MEYTVRQNPREKLAEREVKRLIRALPGELDFYDVVNMVPERCKIRVMKGEAKAALVHMINSGELIEMPNRTIQLPRRK
jgi:hypothetical protein